MGDSLAQQNRSSEFSPSRFGLSQTMWCCTIRTGPTKCAAFSSPLGNAHKSWFTHGGRFRSVPNPDRNGVAAGSQGPEVGRVKTSKGSPASNNVRHNAT